MIKMSLVQCLTLKFSQFVDSSESSNWGCYGNIRNFDTPGASCVIGKRQGLNYCGNYNLLVHLTHHFSFSQKVPPFSKGGFDRILSLPLIPHTHVSLFWPTDFCPLNISFWLPLFPTAPHYQVVGRALDVEPKDII